MSTVSRQLYYQVVDLIRQHSMLNPGDHLLVGVSGGMDSVVLLHVLYHLRQHFNISLHVAHLNHQLRGAEAVRDATFVAHLAEQLNLPYTVESRDVRALIRQQIPQPASDNPGTCCQLKHILGLARNDPLGQVPSESVEYTRPQKTIIVLWNRPGKIRSLRVHSINPKTANY